MPVRMTKTNISINDLSRSTDALSIINMAFVIPKAGPKESSEVRTSQC